MVILLEGFIQVYLGDTAGSVPDHHSKASCHLFVGGGSCLQFVLKNEVCLYSVITIAFNDMMYSLHRKYFARTLTQFGVPQGAVVGSYWARLLV